MNPFQIVQQMISNPIMQNPTMKNAVNMAQRNDVNGLKEIAQNLCKERNLNLNDMQNQVLQRLNMGRRQ